MTADIVLLSLAAVFIAAGIANCVATGRYARQAKASASVAEAARARSEKAREQAAELRKEKPKSGMPRLSYESVVPIVAALRNREAVGYGALLPPFAACPICGQAPTELLVRNDHPDQFLEDRIAFGFRPCGHNFTADAEDVYRASEQP